jgi:hypothetical protein
MYMSQLWILICGTRFRQSLDLYWSLYCVPDNLTTLPFQQECGMPGLRS